MIPRRRQVNRRRKGCGLRFVLIFEEFKNIIAGMFKGSAHDPPTASLSLAAMGFVAVGIFSFGLICSLLLVKPDVLAGSPTRGSVLAITHLASLGWIGSLLFAGAYLFGPVLAGVQLWSSRMPFWHLFCHAAGLAMMLAALAVRDNTFTGVGAGLVYLGIVMLFINLQITGNISPSRSLAHVTLQTALFWLAATGAIALYMIRARLTGETLVPTEILVASHAHFALFGFLVQAMLGVSLRLVPYLLGIEESEQKKQWFGWAGWCSLNIGLVILFPVIATHSQIGRVLVGALILLGVAGYFVQIAAQFFVWRRRAYWSPWMHGTGGFLLLATVFGALVSYPHVASGTPEALREWMRIYISLLLLGPFAFALFGAGGQLIPRMIWSLRFGPWVGRSEVPDAESLRISAAGGPVYFSLLLAWIYLAMGEITHSAEAIRLGALLLLTAFAWFLVAVSPALVRFFLGVTPSDLGTIRTPDNKSHSQFP